jgi:hypothetical protein
MSMTSTSDAFRVPEELRTDEFLLRPIRATDAQLDYEAVMESKDFLRLWEQTTWPEDDFTVAANRADLERLEQRHTDGESFTYTVMHPDETQCLGCVYIVPTGARQLAKSEIAAIDGDQWSDYQVAVYFWIRKSRLADGLDQRLLATLGPWLERDWHIGRHLIVTSEQYEHQVSLIEDTGLSRLFRLKSPNETGYSLAYGIASTPDV